MYINSDSDEDSNSLFNEFLRSSSSISYVASGAGGIGLEVVNPTNKTYNILSTDNANVVCSKLFIKILPIYNVEPVKEILRYSSVSVYSSLSTQFIDEVNLQNRIYKISNFGLEAICPPVINAQIHDNDITEKFIDLLIEKPDNNSGSIKNGLLSTLKERIQNNNDIQLGVIAMGFTENYITLHNAMKSYPKVRTDYFKKLAVYELIRLYDLGYLHGDFSLSNILINPDYIYTGKTGENDKGRAMLIDFGASFSVPPRKNDTGLSIKDKIDIMLDTPVPYLKNIIPRTFSSNNWTWLVSFSSILSLPDILEMITKLFNRIVNHNRIMIQMIKSEYPDIYKQMIEYNNDLDYIYVGGNDSGFNDIAKMKAIFNAANLDIKSIGKRLKRIKNTKSMKKGCRKHRTRKGNKSKKRVTKKSKKSHR